MSRIEVYGEGGHNKDLPFENLIEVIDVDDETQERVTYHPPFKRLPALKEEHHERNPPPQDQAVLPTTKDLKEAQQKADEKPRQEERGKK